VSVRKTRVPWLALLVAASVWVVLCPVFAAAGCGGKPSGAESRFEVVHVQRLDRGETLRVLRDVRTGEEYLLYKGDGTAALYLLGKGEEKENGRADRPAQVSRGVPRTLRVVATGYTAGPESTGKRPGDPGYGVTKSGLPAARGMCAVDPAVIPLGTVLYVPGYGYAVAGDTGSAIKGNKVDLFFPTVEEAEKWGVRKVDVMLVFRNGM